MGRLIVYYDEHCAICQAMKHWFMRLTRGLVSIEWRHYESVPVCGLGDYQCAESMSVQTADGTIYRGFFAVRFLVRYTRLFFLAPLLYVPGMSVIGQKAYQWVARNRHRLFASGRK